MKWIAIINQSATEPTKVSILFKNSVYSEIAKNKITIKKLTI